jgi:23S rRNA (pseudouridine1915-N3)-methyltransferase
MRVRVLCVGSVKGPLQAAIGDYESRAGRYWRFEVIEVPAGVGKGRSGNPEQVRKVEEDRLLARTPAKGGALVALTREGKGFGSRKLAEYLSELAARSTEEVTFVIGGAFGLGKGILDRCSLKIALSPMTLPHEIARLVLAEQLYRAGTILRNEPYHKGP